MIMMGIKEMGDANDVSEDVNDRILEEILSLCVNHLHQEELRKVFDASMDVVFHLAYWFNFTNSEIGQIKACQYGGGEPNKCFVSFLHTEDVTTKELRDIFKRSDSSIKYKLEDLLGEKNHISEFTPEDLSTFANLLIGDPKNVFIIGWKHVAEKLGYAALISYFEEAKSQGGSYSATLSMFKTLENKNVSIRRLQEALSKSHQRSIDQLKYVLGDMVQLEKKRRAKVQRAQKTDKSIELGSSEHFVAQSVDDLSVFSELCVLSKSDVIDGNVTLSDICPNEGNKVSITEGEARNMVNIQTFPPFSGSSASNGDILTGKGCNEVIQSANLQSPITKTMSNSENNTEALSKVSVQKAGDHQDLIEECHQEEPTLEKLEWKHICELRNYLDPITQPCNWCDLGKVIFHGDEKMITKVEALNLNYAGGGSPARKFIGYFKTNFDYTIKQFIDIAAELDRNDIVRLFEKYEVNVHSKFNHIEYLLEIQICDLLDVSGRAIANWKVFARRVGYEDNVINTFQNAILANQQYSPTEGLLDLIKMSRPRYKLRDLSDALSKLERNDVKQYIDNVSKQFI